MVTAKREYETFETALTQFHRYSAQNDIAVNLMQSLRILPQSYQTDFRVLDIGAGQGHLPILMAPSAQETVLIEPNPRCVKVLQNLFPTVYAMPWDQKTALLLHKGYPQGFNLITMSHMLYHLSGLDEICQGMMLAFDLLKPGGHLAVILNQPQAIMAELGITYRIHTGDIQSVLVNQQIHRLCHQPDFYEGLFPKASISLHTFDVPLKEVPSREVLIHLLRMCLLNPLSTSPSDLQQIDDFTQHYLEAHYPSLTFPATISCQDQMIVIQR